MEDNNDPFKKIIQIKDVKKKTEEFLKYKQHFSLGDLETESFHPLTNNFSQLIQESTEEGLKLLKEVDHLLLEKQKKYFEEIFFLAQEMVETAKGGGRIFLVGCGATGRLSLLIESLYHSIYKQMYDKPIPVHSIMAGGDYAFIKSVEAFEDSFTYSIRQLKEKGFCAKDLLIGITEGGETTFVLSAINHASQVCQRYPFYLYCNPSSQLELIKRSSDILSNQKVHKVYIDTGPMAISGSTRMQATTAQLLFVCEALEAAYYKLNEIPVSKSHLEEYWLQRIDRLQSLDYLPMVSLIEGEYQIYNQGGLITYLTDAYCALSVLTDTTERSPTFSLLPFPSIHEEHHSWCYLVVKEDGHNAWEKIMGRPVSGLEWEHLQENISTHDILNFDLSSEALKRRQNQGLHAVIDVECRNFKLNFALNNLEIGYENFNHPIYNHLALKVLLNSLSTSVMGMLGRVEGNMMTFVKASNCKLVDRAIRYAQRILLEKHNRDTSYEDLAFILFDNTDRVTEEKPIVSLMVSAVLENGKSERS